MYLSKTKARLALERIVLIRSRLGWRRKKNGHKFIHYLRLFIIHWLFVFCIIITYDILRQIQIENENENEIYEFINALLFSNLIRHSIREFKWTESNSATIFHYFTHRYIYLSIYLSWMNNNNQMATNAVCQCIIILNCCNWERDHIVK